MKYSYVGLIGVLGFAGFVYAANAQDVASAFQKVVQVPEISIKVPTVVEVPFRDIFANRLNFAVLDTTTSTFVPSLFKESLRNAKNPVTVSVNGVLPGQRMVDDNADTYQEFLVPQAGEGQAALTLTSEKPITLNGFTLLLDRYVALPSWVEVRAVVDGQSKIVLAHTAMRTSAVVFPQTVAREWHIAFGYGQLLRINEVLLAEESPGIENFQALRFLAQPGHTYRIYADADRPAALALGESPDLVSDKGVLVLSRTGASANPEYVLGDTDGDKIPDIRDNCVSVSNPDQVDVDQNSRGDACDDFDRDGVINSKDNCVNDPNSSQADVDGDKVGDICDTEESRFTEKYPWLPWAGMGFAGLVLIALFAITVGSMRRGS